MWEGVQYWDQITFQEVFGRCTLITQGSYYEGASRSAGLRWGLRCCISRRLSADGPVSSQGFRTALILCKWFSFFSRLCRNQSSSLCTGELSSDLFYQKKFKSLTLGDPACWSSRDWRPHSSFSPNWKMFKNSYGIVKPHKHCFKQPLLAQCPIRSPFWGPFFNFYSGRKPGVSLKTSYYNALSV